MNTFDFIEVVFIFFGVYEKLQQENNEFEQLALNNSLEEGKTGNNLEYYIIDYKNLEAPALVDIYGTILHDFIINQSEYSIEDAMNLSVKWMKSSLFKEYGTAIEDLDLIESYLQKLIYDIDNGRIKIESDLDIVCIKQLALSNWWQDQVWYKENKVKRPNALTPIYEQNNNKNTSIKVKGSPSKADIHKINALNKIIENLSAKLLANHNIELQKNERGKIIIPLTPKQISELLLGIDSDIFKILKKGSITDKTFWKKQKQFILASHRELTVKEFKKTQKTIISL